MPVYLSRCIIFAFALLLAACSTTEVRQGPVVKAKSILLLPLSSLHNELAEAANNIKQDLNQVLEKKKFTVINPNEQQVQAANDQALAAAGAVYDPSIGQF